jgi:hypothetical protein
VTTAPWCTVRRGARAARNGAALGCALAGAVVMPAAAHSSSNDMAMPVMNSLRSGIWFQSAPTPQYSVPA